MTPKTRDFRTTGVVLKIEAQWMTNDGGNKHLLADALHDLMVREHSISPSDIHGLATNIAMVVDGQRRPVKDAIIIYDATYGSLRLTERVFKELASLIDRLQRSSELSSDEGALVPASISSALRDWYEELEATDPDEFPNLSSGGSEPAKDGLLLVLAPGSIAARRDRLGVLHDIEILGSEMVSFDGPPKLFYRYKNDSMATTLVAAEAVETIGDEYQYCEWDPRTSKYIENDEEKKG